MKALLLLSLLLSLTAKADYIVTERVIGYTCPQGFIYEYHKCKRVVGMVELDRMYLSVPKTIKVLPYNKTVITVEVTHYEN